MAENTQGPEHEDDREADLEALLEELEAIADALRASEPQPGWWGANADEARLLETLDREVELWTRRQADQEQWTWERFGALEDPCEDGECETPALGRCCAGPHAIRCELAVLEARMRLRPSQALADEIMRLRSLLGGSGAQ